MELKEALWMVSDGHAVYTEEAAHKVCEVFGVKPIKGWKMYSDPPGTHKGLTMDEEGAVGVDGRSLSQHVVSELGLEVRSYIGRGFQAQANARAIAEHFKK